jgi:hypothetical protein
MDDVGTELDVRFATIGSSLELAQTLVATSLKG